ncbi:MAG: glycosyltransferase family 2 protein [Flavobacteriales bacterium]|nr:glycosyltransferase family 2 protein [Flavobacteriales bacterium]MCB9166333.1 glycosyltransferase family 2 protein [Flavobacteriales bacterium]
MKVSVLVPVYNKAAYVEEAVRSVLDGTWRDLEVIAVDDASTDGSAQVLERITDPRLRIVRHAANRGPAAAANTGIDAAHGEYIVRLDADDIAVPERVAKQVALMDAHPGIGASGGWLQLFGERDVAWRFPLTDEACRSALLFRVPLSQGASIVRRSVLEEHHLRYDPDWPRVGEDWLFWARIAPHTRFANLDEPLTLYRRGTQNISHGRDKVDTHRAILERLLPMFGVTATPERIDAHLMALTYFATPPDAAAVRRVHAWLQWLIAWNDEQARFPKAAFESTVQAQWDRLFHYLPRHGWSPALAHLRLSRSWPFDRLDFLLRTRINAVLGRL